MTIADRLRKIADDCEERARDISNNDAHIYPTELTDIAKQIRRICRDLDGKSK